MQLEQAGARALGRGGLESRVDLAPPDVAKRDLGRGLDLADRVGAPFGGIARARAISLPV